MLCTAAALVALLCISGAAAQANAPLIQGESGGWRQGRATFYGGPERFLQNFKDRGPPPEYGFGNAIYGSCGYTQQACHSTLAGGPSNPYGGTCMLPPAACLIMQDIEEALSTFYILSRTGEYGSGDTIYGSCGLLQQICPSCNTSGCSLCMCCSRHAMLFHAFPGHVKPVRSSLLLSKSL